MNSRAFEVGDRVRIVVSGFSRGPAAPDNSIGIVRSVDKSRRRTEPYYIYSVEFPGNDTLLEYEYRELELVAPESNEALVQLTR